MPSTVLHTGGATGAPEKITIGAPSIAGVLITPVTGAIRVSGADVTATLGQPIAVGERADLPVAGSTFPAWYFASQSGSAVDVMVTAYEGGE